MTCVNLVHDGAQWQSFILSRTHDKEFLDELHNNQLHMQDVYIVLGRKHAKGVLHETLKRNQVKQVTGLLIGHLKNSSSK